MEFKDYYAQLGVAHEATQDEIKKAYRKLARKYHPDVSKLADAEERFKEIAEAYAALNDVEKRAAYDDVCARYAQGQDFNPPPDWASGFEYSGRGENGTGRGRNDFSDSDFFDALFGRRSGFASAHSSSQDSGDQHAKVLIDLIDAYRGAQRSISLRVAQREANGRSSMQERQLTVNIPKGIRAGQQLRLAGQGNPANGSSPAGDLYLEIGFTPHPQFRVDGRDVYVNVAVTPWEAALGAVITAATPDGSVALSLPAGSGSGRKLRLKGKGIPGTPSGDLYAILSIALPPADTEQAQAAYKRMAEDFNQFNPRSPQEA